MDKWEEHCRQWEQHVQRPRGQSEPDVFREQQGAMWQN